jgi:hypothetical protein
MNTLTEGQVEEFLKLFRGHYRVECLDKDGNPKWLEEYDNLVTNEGRTDILEKYFKGSAYTAAWFVGFKGALTGQAAGDTLASHAGWTEVNPQGANRQALTFNTAASQSIATGQFNVSITATGPTDVGGAFVATAQTGSSGKLWSVGDFSQLRSVVAGDTLQVSVTFNS